MSFILFLGRAIICCEKHPFNGHGKTAFGSACQATCRKCRNKIYDKTGYEISLQIAVPVQKQEGIIFQGQKVKVEKSRQEVKIGKEVTTALGFKFKVSSIKPTSAQLSNSYGFLNQNWRKSNLLHAIYV